MIPLHGVSRALSPLFSPTHCSPSLTSGLALGMFTCTMNWDILPKNPHIGTYPDYGGELSFNILFANGFLGKVKKSFPKFLKFFFNAVTCEEF